MLVQLGRLLLPLTIVFALAFAAVAIAIGCLLAVLRSAHGGIVVANLSWAYIYALVIGMALVHRYLPLYVMHGTSRRNFLTQAFLFLAAFSGLLAALLAAMWLVEVNVYRFLAMPHTGGPSRLLLGVLELWPLLAAWTSGGMVTAAAVYRWKLPGLAVFPLVLLLIGFAETALRFDPPFFGLLMEFRVPSTMGWVGALLVIPIQCALAWALLRDVSLHYAPR